LYTKEPKFEAPTWKHIYGMVLKLAEKICNDNLQPDVIVGVSRGGWVPARLLSDFLENPNLASTRVEYYTGINETEKAPMLTQCISTDVRGKIVLIVDEVADRGESLEVAKAHAVQQGASNVKTATMYCKPWSKIKPDYYGEETKCWIVLPWEINELVKLICKKHKAEPSIFRAELAKLSEAGVSKQLIKYFLKGVQ
jgi:hypoxanthine phosphoribosyltransferase